MKRKKRCPKSAPLSDCADRNPENGCCKPGQVCGSRFFGRFILRFSNLKQLGQTQALYLDDCNDNLAIDSATNSIVRSFSASGGSFLAAVICNIIRMTPEKQQRLRSNICNIILWKYVGALQFFGLIFAYTLMYPGMNTMADHGLGGMCFPMLVGSCIVAFTLASVWLLKEKLRPLQLGALVFCISGLIAICLPY